MSQERSIPDLIECLRSAKRRFLGPDWKKRTECAQALGTLGATAATGDLIAVVHERGNTDLCRACVTALVQIGNEEALRGLVHLLSLEDHQDVHADVILGLAQIESEVARHALGQVSDDVAVRRTLVRGLSHELQKATHLLRPDWDRRVMAVNALGVLRAGEAVDDMVQELARHKEPRLWDAVVAVLTLIGDERAAQALVASWQWADGPQSEAICRSLLSLGTEYTDQPLIDGLSQEMPAVRGQAWQVLVQTNALPRLIAALEDPDESRHMQAKKQLVQIGERGVAALLAALEHDIAQVRRLAASALVDIGGEAVEHLMPVLALWAQSPETPHVTKVGGHSAAEPISLEEAVRSALPGGIIQLALDVYHLSSPMRIEKPLALIGAGKDHSRITGEAAEWLVSVDTEGPFCAADLTFENTGSLPASVVEVAAAEVGLYRCRFTGGSVGDHDLSGPMAEVVEFADDAVVLEDLQGPILLRVPEEPSGGDGLRLLASTRGTVSECECVDNGKVGLAVIDQAAPTVKDSVCSTNWAGLLIEDGATATVVEARCNDNHLHGIQITGHARASVRDTSCANNGKAGIYVGDEAQALLTGNTCHSNKIGIAFRNQAGGMARQNQCHTNRLAGILVENESQVTIQENVCRGNKASGVAYYEAAGGSASQNQCINNGLNGIRVAGSSSVMLQANTCTGHQGMGILVTADAEPRIERNMCQGNGSGIGYEEQAGGTALGNECKENTTNGIQLMSRAQPRLEDNVCQSNQYCGIFYFDTSSGVAIKNRCDSNGEQGIACAARSRPQVVENTCRYNHGGISVTDDSQAEVIGNLCQENRMNGIGVDCTAAGRLFRNKCLANKANGIVVADEAQPIVEENECRNNGGAGIVYGGMAGGIARGNKCLNNEELGLLLLGDSTHPQLGKNDCRGNKNAQQLRLHDHEL